MNIKRLYELNVIKTLFYIKMAIFFNSSSSFLWKIAEYFFTKKSCLTIKKHRTGAEFVIMS